MGNVGDVGSLAHCTIYNKKNLLMMILSVISFALLFGYLGIMAIRKGIPDMVSDTYYQLGRGRGWIFSAVLTACAVMMMVAILDSEKGTQAAAFLGTMGLVFVGFAPNYLDRDEYKVHKGAAIMSAVGCVAWCLSVNIIPTIVIGSLYAVYWVANDIARIAKSERKHHPWYWAEVSCFADVFASYWMVV